MPTDFDIFLGTWEIWGFQEIGSSRITPRKTVSLTLSIAQSSNVMEKPSWIRFCLGLKIINYLRSYRIVLHISNFPSFFLLMLSINRINDLRSYFLKTTMISPPHPPRAFSWYYKETLKETRAFDGNSHDENIRMYKGLSYWQCIAFTM